eukprot:gb/GECG01015970.1/.p1 GENE.gb/GECG01015970.1/~~gb/GECG01015970.1/.p1  ORF type:complete len:182 (+),score=3.98 gb/GECG01015970.1/:1-546(+)
MLLSLFVGSIRRQQLFDQVDSTEVPQADKPGNLLMAEHSLSYIFRLCLKRWVICVNLGHFFLHIPEVIVPAIVTVKVHRLVLPTSSYTRKTYLVCNSEEAFSSTIPLCAQNTVCTSKFFIMLSMLCICSTISSSYRAVVCLEATYKSAENNHFFSARKHLVRLSCIFLLVCSLKWHLPGTQ